MSEYLDCALLSLDLGKRAPNPKCPGATDFLYLPSQKQLHPNLNLDNTLLLIKLAIRRSPCPFDTMEPHHSFPVSENSQSISTLFVPLENTFQQASCFNFTKLIVFRILGKGYLLRAALQADTVPNSFWVGKSFTAQ